MTLRDGASSRGFESGSACGQPCEPSFAVLESATGEEDEMVDFDAQQTERLIRALESIAESLRALSSCVSAVNPQNPLIRIYDMGQPGR
jgi:hypothetical protein